MSNFDVPESGPSGTWAALERHPAPNPLDAGRIPCAQGGEDRWSARWLMEALGYESWQKFEGVIERAKTTAHNEGFNVRILFRVTAKAGAGQVFTGGDKNPGGRPGTDYSVTRYAAYLIAMNGDTRKQQVSDAQHYFAVKTREAETSAPTPPAVMPSHAEALRGWADTLERAELAESKARELAVPASAWNELAESSGDYSVADASKVLSRDPNVSIRERALFQFMSGLGWVFKRDGRWKAYRTQLETGRLAEKVARPYWHEGRGEMVAGEPTVRITPKGLAEIHRRLGGSGQLALVAEVSSS